MTMGTTSQLELLRQKALQSMGGNTQSQSDQEMPSSQATSSPPQAQHRKKKSASEFEDLLNDYERRKIKSAQGHLERKKKTESLTSMTVAYSSPQPLIPSPPNPVNKPTQPMSEVDLEQLVMELVQLGTTAEELLQHGISQEFVERMLKKYGVLDVDQPAPPSVHIRDHALNHTSSLYDNTIMPTDGLAPEQTELANAASMSDESEVDMEIEEPESPVFKTRKLLHKPDMPDMTADDPNRVHDSQELISPQPSKPSIFNFPDKSPNQGHVIDLSDDEDDDECATIFAGIDMPIKTLKAAMVGPVTQPRRSIPRAKSGSAHHHATALQASITEMKDRIKKLEELRSAAQQSKSSPEGTSPVAVRSKSAPLTPRMEAGTETVQEVPTVPSPSPDQKSKATVPERKQASETLSTMVKLRSNLERQIQDNKAELLTAEEELEGLRKKVATAESKISARQKLLDDLERMRKNVQESIQRHEAKVAAETSQDDTPKDGPVCSYEAPAANQADTASLDKTRILDVTRNATCNVGESEEATPLASEEPMSVATSSPPPRPLPVKDPIYVPAATRALRQSDPNGGPLSEDVWAKVFQSVNELRQKYGEASNQTNFDSVKGSIDWEQVLSAEAYKDVAGITAPSATPQMEKQPERTAQAGTYFKPYKSRLSHLRSYQLFADSSVDSVGMWNPKWDKDQKLCRYETAGGACNDPTCQAMHFRDIKIRGRYPTIGLRFAIPECFLDDAVLLEMVSYGVSQDTAANILYYMELADLLEWAKAKSYTRHMLILAVQRFRVAFLKDPSRRVALRAGPG
ncbi:hypothetical protein BZG36_02409 [Bifiguratus adelaidae]|uniref:Putative zinc-finger domain-containing protein n=1 Tax=Bifiguratus adelaidae TaxID=1938954 RepID=A0A261Y1D7_9FUNG|nr:hypothetical protein BZG36_02409 [Bifiguratus adelaidae]